jgi:hypothetical protein
LSICGLAVPVGVCPVYQLSTAAKGVVIFKCTVSEVDSCVFAQSKNPAGNDYADYDTYKNLIFEKMHNVIYNCGFSTTLISNYVLFLLFELLLIDLAFGVTRFKDIECRWFGLPIPTTGTSFASQSPYESRDEHPEEYPHEEPEHTGPKGPRTIHRVTVALIG